MDHYGFYTGRVFDAYQYLGGHLDGAGAVFRTFAPAAGRVSVIGEFSGWREIPMGREHEHPGQSARPDKPRTPAQDGTAAHSFHPPAPGRGTRPSGQYVPTGAGDSG